MVSRRSECALQVSVPHEGIVGNTALQYQAFEDDSLMDIARDEPDLRSYLECACNGLMACSTCHVIVDPVFYEAVGIPSDAENDMLDLAHGLTPTSRLGCQIILRPDIDGLHVTVPDGVNNVWS